MHAFSADPVLVPAPEYALEAENLCKSFSGVRVLNGVSLQLRPAEVHAFLGENGAGKSTLMKILAGVYAPDDGKVTVRGRVVSPGNPHAALRAGVAMIYQELLPFPDLSVAENILMGLQPRSRLGPWISRRALERRATELLGRLNTPLPPNRRMGDLRVAEMQVVEIAKALAHEARIIIMDEPTSALSEHEAEALFRLIGELQQQGVAIAYITHKLEEVFRLADRVTVLRDGSVVGSGPIAEFQRESLIRLMVGRDLVVPRPGAGANTGELPVLAIHGLTRRGAYREISLELRAGEVLGMAGLMGAGRTEVLKGIYGLDPAESGTIEIHGRGVSIRKPLDALKAGIGLVTEDRKRFGLLPTMGIPQNITLAGLNRCCRAGMLSRAAEREASNEAVNKLGIRFRDARERVENLSGGNQQKVVIGRTLFTEPKILLLDEPTRGIDVHARAEIHAIIRRLAEGGKAVLLVSSEMPELLALCDRILVLRQGKLAGELARQEATPEAILDLAMPE